MMFGEEAPKSPTDSVPTVRVVASFLSLIRIVKFGETLYIPPISYFDSGYHCLINARIMPLMWPSMPTLPITRLRSLKIDL